MHLRTKRGYSLSDVVSAMQKGIRRNDVRVAGYMAMELHWSGYAEYAWRRVLITSAEDCAGLVTQEIKALYDSWAMVGAKMGDKERWKFAGRIFLAKAVILLCTAAKSRDADHLANLVHESGGIDQALVDRVLLEAAGDPIDLPAYTHDCHTLAGKRAGRTRRDFFVVEDRALTPRATLTLFDAEVGRVASGELQPTDRHWRKPA